MKILKRSLLALALVSMSANLLPNNGGAIAGGVIGGLAVGGLIGSSVASHRNPNYRLNKEIRQTEMALDRAERDIERAGSQRSRSRAQDRAARLSDKLNRLNREYAMVNA